MVPRLRELAPRGQREPGGGIHATYYVKSTTCSPCMLVKLSGWIIGWAIHNISLRLGDIGPISSWYASLPCAAWYEFWYCIRVAEKLVFSRARAFTSLGSQLQAEPSNEPAFYSKTTWYMEYHLCEHMWVNINVTLNNNLRHIYANNHNIQSHFNISFLNFVLVSLYHPFSCC